MNASIFIFLSYMKGYCKIIDIKLTIIGKNIRMFDSYIRCYMEVLEW